MPHKDKEKKRERDKAYYEANKEAKAEYYKAYYEANKEAIKERSKAYYEATKEANKEARAKYKKAYRKANKEAIAEYNKAYYEATKEANKEAKAEYKRAWRKANKEAKAEENVRRRALKRNAIPKFLRSCQEEKKRLQKIYRLRQLLSDATGIIHHVDHMWPLSDGGPHWSGNLQIITAQENLSKSATVDEEIKVTIKEGLKYAREACEGGLTNA